jgi:hypothetical protein
MRVPVARILPVEPNHSGNLPQRPEVSLRLLDGRPHGAVLSRYRPPVRDVGGRAPAQFLAGRRAAGFCRLLAQAETDPAALKPACRALNALASSDRYQILAGYAALNRSAA